MRLCVAFLCACVCRSWYSCDPSELFAAKVMKKIRSDETQKKIEKTLLNEARQSQVCVEFFVD